MDLDSARFLASSRGTAALAAARTARERPAHLRVGALAGLGSPEEVRTALQQDGLRVRAAARCPHAEALLFSADALEQATAWPVATERAARWPAAPDETIHDLCAGIGLDALAAAEAGRSVVAYERDAARAHLLAYNARTLGLTEHLEVRLADVLVEPPRGALAYLDPDRRPDGRRTRDEAEYEPPSETWDVLLGKFEQAMVKLPPHGEAYAPAPQPIEVVSLAGRARERRVFYGDWGDLPARRALQLPSGATVEGDGEDAPAPQAVEPGAWLLDPDVAVAAAGLVGDLARRDGLTPNDEDASYLHGDARAPSAPGHWMRVDAVLAARPKAVNAWLKQHEIGNLTIRKRGVTSKAAEWRKRLRPRGPRAGTVVFTRDVRNRWVAYGCFEQA